MKKLFTLFLALAASAGTIFAEKILIGDLYYNLDAVNKTAEVTYEKQGDNTNYSGLTTANIPSSVDYESVTYSVTKIGNSAFRSCSGLTSVTIPNSVTEIGGFAFRGCTNLPVIDNIRYADTYLVEAVDKTLSTYTIKDGTKWIGGSAFYGCTGLTSVTIPNSVTSIGSLAFSGCYGLTSVTIPNSVTLIGNSAFANCSGLTSIIVVEGNTGYDSRNNCNAIIKTATNTLVAGCKNTIISNSVTSIGNSAFEGCTGLTSVTIPNSVTSIGAWAFSGCSGLTSVTIPNSVTSIDLGAFSGCSGLTSVTIPNSVTSIGEAAFFDCTGLTSIIVVEGNTEYDSRNNCNAIIKTATNTLVAVCKNTIIPNSVTSIGEEAFFECSGLTSVTIPNSVTSIGNQAFAYCYDLTSITCEASTPPACGSDVFYEVDKSIPLYVPAESVDLYKSADQWEDFTNILPIKCLIASGTCGAEGDNLTWELSCDSVLTIRGMGAMTDYNWDSPWSIYKDTIKKVIVEEGVTSIGYTAFRDHGHLQECILPSTITSIGEEAFCFCFQLMSIEIPDACTSIGSASFNLVPNVVIKDESILPYNGSARSVNGYVEGLFVYADSSKRSLRACSSAAAGEIVLDDAIERIEYMAFAQCEAITNLHFGSHLQYVGEWSLNGCIGLEGLRFQEGLTEIADAAFGNCFGLQYVYLPNSLTTMGNFAIGNCPELRTIHLGTSLTNVGIQFFDYCQSLDTIYAPMETPPTLDNTAFSSTTLSNVVCIVPYESLSLYQEAAVWKEMNLQAADAPTCPYSGTCGENLTWELSCDSVLTISGTGEMTDYYEKELVPWHEYKEGIQRVHIKEGPTSISWYAFSNCINLHYIDIPYSIRRIGYRAFYNCSNLRDIYMPRYIDIDSSVFDGCTSLPVVDNIRYAHWYLLEAVDKSLETYTIRSNTSVIGTAAFKNCTNMKSITLPFGVMVIGGGAFSGCANLVTFNHDDCFLNKVGGSAFYGCSSLKEITLADSIHFIEHETFEECTALHTVHLGTCVESFDKAAFYHCPALTKIEVAEYSMYLSSVDGVVYSKDQKTFVLYPRGREDSVYHVLTGVTDLSDEAFAACYNIKAIVLPGTVSHLGEVVFDQSPLLGSITCEAIVPPSCEGHSFEGVDFSIPLYVPAESVEAYKAANGWKDFTNIQPIQAEEVPVTEIEAEPTYNSVVIEWPKVDEATVYTIEIRKDGELICTLTFNEQGQLQGITFAKPSRNGGRNSQVRMAIQTATGWQYTISGLDPDTEYTYSVVAKKNASDTETLFSDSVTFTTKQTPTGVDEVSDQPSEVRKLLRNGQLYIFRDGKLFNAQGAKVK